MKSKPIALITALLVVGALRLLPGLDDLSLWVDEGWSAITADQDTLPAVTDMVVEDVHPPLHLYLLHIWRQLTGTSVFALRYMAVLATLLTAAFIYRLGSDLFDNQTGLIASLLYVTHDLVVVLGQEVRQYPLAMLLSVMTVWVYWRFWTETSWQRGVAFVVSGAALLWTLYWGGFVLLSLGVHAMVTQPRRVVRFASANLVIGILFLPWVPILLQQTVDDLPEGIGHALPAETNSYEILAFQLLGRPEIFWGILGIAGTFHLGRRRWWPDATTMLLASVVGITLALSIALNYFYASLSFRNLAILLPPFGLLVGHTIARFRSYERAILVLIAVAFGLTLTDAGPPTRLPWPRIANHITHHSRADDVVLIETWFDTYAFEYYLEDVESIRSQVRRRDENKAPPGFTGDEVGAAQGIWIMRFASDTDIRPALHDLGFVDSGSFQWQTPLSPVDLWRLDRPAEGLVEVFGTEIALNRYSVRRQPDGVSVTLLWTPTVPPTENYTVSTFLLNETGLLVAQSDNYPLQGHSPTIAWQTDRYYYDSHYLGALGLPPGDYQVGLKLYLNSPSGNLVVQGPQSCAPACEYILLSTITVE